MSKTPKQFTEELVEFYTTAKINAGRAKLKMKAEKAHKMAEWYKGKETAYGDVLGHLRQLVKMMCLLVFVLFTACQDEEIWKQEDSKCYSFDVRAEDHSPFDGVVNWGIDGIQYKDRLKHKSGYGSCFLVSAGDVAWLQIDSTLPFVEVEIEGRGKQILQTNQLHKFQY